VDTAGRDPKMNWRRVVKTLGSLTALALCTLLTWPAAAAELQFQPLSTAELSEPEDHWVYVADITFPHMPDSKVVVLDGDAETTNEAYLGMISTGYNPGMALAPDDSAVYVAETYYSRGTRGERDDIVTIFDTQTLEPTGEIAIPEKRHMSVTQPQGTVLADGGRYLLVMNVTPATSVSVVDLEAGEFLGEIAIAGCALIYPAPEGRQFSTLCNDGSMLTVGFDANGQETYRNRIDLFDPEQEHYFEPVTLGDTTYFVSHQGTVLPVDMSGRQPQPQDPWSLLTAQQRARNWKPGGWQLQAVHRASGRMYVIMHQGGDHTHKDPGAEVWVYDLSERTRVDRIALQTPALSIKASSDDAPLLFAINASFGLDVYDAMDGAHQTTFTNFASTPFMMRTP
jgi:methylamine dehydrogenase heavy chain